MKIELFNRNKADSDSPQDDQLHEAAFPAEDGEIPAANGQKKHFRFKVSVQKMFSRKKKQKDGAEEAAAQLADAVTGLQDPPEPVTQLEEKPKKERKKKEPKPKKVKPPKEKKPKGEKKKPVLAFTVGGASVVTVGVIVAAVLLTGGKSVEKLLDTAKQYTEEEQYYEAERIYRDILEDQTIVDAHLGLAENYYVQEMYPEAINILEQGLAVTNDGVIAQRLEILREEVGEESGPPAAEPIAWADSTLEAMVRDGLGVSAAEPISEQDLEHITVLKIVGPTHISLNPNADESIKNLNSTAGYTIDGTLYTERGTIQRLDDLNHFKNLRKLTIGYNSVRDISGLAGLTGLETLGLYFNDISSLSALSAMDNLQYLYVYNNQITDLSPLSGLSSLRILYAQNNQISDVSALGDLSTLVELSVSGNSITDISSLRGLSNLNFLFADNNQIESISVLEGMESLTDVSFTGNPVGDYTPASHVQNINRS